ncbi:ribosomal-protein-alanine N-acetyltransferase [Actinoplanes octamycinicus]|uniref:Ribosomal-protein-alanine N-acetyltransferase n=1 Tax=Actinoplanes octamycinicus TaxID=135948 RepID=A0A7W7GRQ9_9ACTN|nr:GNAT family N-acetyltransferase [Actinoplanes octamycinicus]MBB4737083.1 ribosomal-protein-alanine N-acetyltransferase [Actinoplanes octamycinicus]GIE63368.1 ribosomal-protein-alanine N-acetyltransferase [Actinoplanes octamycinicus]
MTAVVRPLAMADVPELTEVLNGTRDYLAPWDPIRDESFYTVEGQRQLLTDLLRPGNALPHVILDDGRIAGRINLVSIVRGPFQSASLGYWVAERHAGRGLASAAVAEVLRLAFTSYELHRVEASTLLHNERSQRVLAKNGFQRFGMAPRYLKIAGEWQDHYLFQIVAENWVERSAAAT